MNAYDAVTHVRARFENRIYFGVRAAVPVFIVGLGIVGLLSIYVPEAVVLGVAGAVGGLAFTVWPQSALVLYTNAGLFKMDPRLNGITGGVDLTLAFGAILVAATAYYLILRRQRLVWSQEIGIMLVFCAVIVMGLAYTPALGYGTDKAMRFISLTLLAFLTPFVVMKSRRDVWIFFGTWIALALVFALDALSRLGADTRLSAFNATSIGMSRMLGVALLVLLFGVLMQPANRVWQIGALLSIGLFLIALLGSGSRGPLLSLVVTVGLTVSMSVVRPDGHLRSIVILALLALLCIGVVYSGIVPSMALQRFDILLSQAEVDTSAQARVQVMEEAWRLFKTSPVLGHGIGSVSAFGAGREQVYPHNILLELAAETGMLGLGLYLLIIAMVFRRLLLKLAAGSDRASLHIALMAILIFTLLNAMVSGDINDNRDLWLFAGMATALTTYEEEALTS